MRFGLFCERLANETGKRLTASQRTAQVHLMIAEQACAQPAVRCEARPVARAAVRVCHWSDHADAAGGTAERVVRRWTISAWRTATVRQRTERVLDTSEHFIARHDHLIGHRFER